MKKHMMFTDECALQGLSCNDCGRHDMHRLHSTRQLPVVRADSAIRLLIHQIASSIMS